MGVALVLAADATAALRSLAGRTLIERAVLTARDSGAREVFVLAADEDCAARLRDKAASAVVVPMNDLGVLRGALGTCRDAPLLWLSATRVYDVGLAAFPEWSKGVPEGGEMHVAMFGGPVAEPGLWLSRCDLAGRMDDGALAAALAAASPEPLASGIALDIIRHAATAGHAIDVHDSTTAGRAMRALLRGCRKPGDGLVARHFNRYVSLFITGRIAAILPRIAPNHVTAFSVLVGFAASWVLALKGTAGLALGASILVVQEILDGIDGELARLTWRSSRLGELLDTGGDVLVLLAFAGTLCVTVHQDGAHVTALAGFVGLAAWSGFVGLLFGELRAIGRGDILIATARLQERGPLPEGRGLRALHARWVRTVVRFNGVWMRHDVVVPLILVAGLCDAAPLVVWFIFGSGLLNLGYGVYRLGAPLSRSALD
ncbi:MAG: CDP-alcohol phosphatidyltransferase family protein [Deltaproteobacteria bacterium]|nr:CDP-alcohol phosphatidyltransferase family protein [Deltaproteobacteria bacterium]